MTFLMPSPATCLRIASALVLGWLITIGSPPAMAEDGANENAAQKEEGEKKDPPAADGEEAIFSGPQPGEELPRFTIRRFAGAPEETPKKEEGDPPGKPEQRDFDPIAAADGKPVVLLFVHETTRPGMALSRAVMHYVASKQPEGISGAVVFLSADPTKTENWAQVARGSLPPKIPSGVSLDGLEGPPAWGLNRNVGITVAIGSKGKGVASFALVQPSVQADAPRIGKAIAELLDAKPPTLAEMGVNLRGERGADQAGMPDMRSLLAPLIRRDADAAEVDKAAAAIEAAAAKDERVKSEVHRIAKTIVDSGKLANYGTPAAQEYLRRWAK